MTVADPGFPRWRELTLKVGVLTYYLAKFFPKTAWKWKKLDPGGAPPWRPLRSANEWENIFIQAIWYNSIIVACPNVPITSILTDFSLGSWKDFDVGLLLIGSRRNDRNTAVSNWYNWYNCLKNNVEQLHFIWGRAELHWNFSSIPKDGSDIYGYSNRKFGFNHVLFLEISEYQRHPQVG